MPKMQLRFLVSLGIVLFILLLAIMFARFWPVAFFRVDPEQTPFIGNDQVNGYAMHTNIVTNASGRFRTHKIILGVLAICVLVGGFFQGIRSYLSREVVIPSFLKLGRSNVFFMLGALLILFPMILAVRNIPDFSEKDDAHMAVANMHYSFIIGHADKLSQGDKLFEEVSPKYGMLITVFIAGLEKVKGHFLSLGNTMKMVQISEIVFLFFAMHLYWRWSNRRILLCVIPTLFLIKWFYSSSNIIIPMNHSPIRTAGLTLAIFVLFLLRNASLWLLGTAGGCLMAIALLNNVESGLACSVGVSAFLFLRSRKYGSNIFQNLFKLVLFAIFGFLLVWLVFSLVCFVVLGVHFGIGGLSEYLILPFHGASGFWATPDPVGWWPIFMFLHVSFGVVYSAFSKRISFREAYLCSIGVMFLVWFVYFINRPEPTYLCSFYFLYGFFVIELQTRLIKSLRSIRVFSFDVLFFVLPLVLVYSQASDAMNWAINPFDWRVNNFVRWQVPLVKKGSPQTVDAVHVGGVYLSQGYAHSLVTRSEFLKNKSVKQINNRSIYFTVDSYLIPHTSGILPFQEFADPFEAINKKYYDRLIESVIKSPFDEIYFDARDEKKLIWYGGMFQMVRKDLSKDFEKVRVESGWEIWRRTPHLN